jgi:hypothetical protein
MNILEAEEKLKNFIMDGSILTRTIRYKNDTRTEDEIIEEFFNELDDYLDLAEAILEAKNDKGILILEESLKIGEAARDLFNTETIKPLMYKEIISDDILQRSSKAYAAMDKGCKEYEAEIIKLKTDTKI